MTFDEAIREPGIYEGLGQRCFILVTSMRGGHNPASLPSINAQNGVVYFSYRDLPAALENGNYTICEPAWGIVDDDAIEWVKRDHLQLMMVLKTEDSSDA